MYLVLSKDLGLKNVIHKVSETETSLESCLYKVHFTQYTNPNLPFTSTGIPIYLLTQMDIEFLLQQKDLHTI
jgi:hypothetical protein